MKQYVLRPFLAVLGFCAVSVLQIGCTTTDSGAGGDGFYAPAPSSPIERTTQLQNRFSTFNNSQFF